MPKYNPSRENIYRFIFSQITDGSLKGGAKIPTEMELANRFGMNRSNVHLALKHLEQEGLIVRRKRLGSFLRNPIPSDVIKSLRCRYEKSVHIILSSCEDAEHVGWNESSLNYLEKYLQDNGYSLVYKVLPRGREEMKNLVAQIAGEGSGAMLIFPKQTKEIQFILNNKDVLDKYYGEIFFYNRGACSPDDFPDNFCVLYADPYDEGKLLGEYLNEKSCSNVYFMYLARNVEAYWLKQRIAGIRDKLKESKEDLKILIYDDEKFFEKILEIFTGAEEKPVFVCQADGLAASFVIFMQEKGWNVKEDYLVVSFDNSPKYRRHNLTTVATPCEKMCQALASLICNSDWQRVEGISLKIKLLSYLVKRESC